MSLKRFLHGVRQSLKFGRQKPRARMSSRPLLVEALEERMLLAGNLKVTDVYLTSIKGDRLNEPAVGARVFARVDFEAQNLSPGDRYNIRFTLDGEVRE